MPPGLFSFHLVIENRFKTGRKRMIFKHTHLGNQHDLVRHIDSVIYRKKTPYHQTDRQLKVSQEKLGFTQLERAFCQALLDLRQSFRKLVAESNKFHLVLQSKQAIANPLSFPRVRLPLAESVQAKSCGTPMSEGNHDLRALHPTRAAIVPFLRPFLFRS